MSFAKLFQFDDIGQVLVKRDTNDNHEPEVRLYFEPEGFGVCSTAFTFEEGDGENMAVKAERAFDLVDEERAHSIITGVLKTVPKVLKDEGEV